MIHIGVVGNRNTAIEASKRGFAVLTLEPEIEEAVRSIGGRAVLIGDSDTSVRIAVGSVPEAALMLVKSSHILVLCGGPHKTLVKTIAKSLKKPFIEGKGGSAINQAKEWIVRYNLFGKK